MRRVFRFLMALAVLVSATPLAAGQTASRASPLDVRVTVAYRNRPASEVLSTLTRAAGLTVAVATGELLPVTLALTNARLETALNAVCENASCRWTLRDRTVTVTPMPIEPGTLPRAISLALSEASVRDVFHALAAALNLQLELDGELPTSPVTITFRNAPPEHVLNFVAMAARCSWEFQPGRLIVRRLPQ